MKLLFDQNLSPRLPRLLAELYPQSVHVRDIGLRDVSDEDIWEYAKQGNYVIVSKDTDFQQRSLLRGHPPNLFGYGLAIVRSKRLKICYESIP
jgi:predicted nuclease of predicted toxin-antitoxin system